MFTIFKYIGYALKAKQGITKPDEFIADTSFGLIEGVFIISFIILGILSLGLLFLGFYYNIVGLIIFGVVLSLILGVDVAIYLKVKQYIRRVSKNITDIARNSMSQRQAIDSDVTDVQ